ncbi:MAG TPA: DUF2793 domain-containing protein [Devosia sp.]|nr:DUF2793 domain-containing protein [Devosia sp.]
MSTTARLALPYIAPQQAQKQVSYNEAMALLDRLVQPMVKSRTVSAPPGSPAEGDSYIVAASGSGAWVGKDGKLASWLDGGWEFLMPGEGWLAFVEDDAEFVLHHTGAWSALIGADGFEEGIWTPDLQFGGAAMGIAYAARTGRFRRIGRQVAVTARIVLSSKGSATGSAQIGGLPFASRDDGMPAAAAIGFADNLTGLTGTLQGAVEADATLVSLYQSAASGMSALADAEFTNSAELAFTATYEAA